MNLTRIKTFALCLGVALVLMAGSVFAATTKTTVVNFGREVGVANRTYNLPANSPTRQTGFVRATNQPFYVDITLSGGALWTSGTLDALSTASPLVSGDLVVSGTATYTSGIITATGATARWLVQISGAAEVAPPLITLTATGRSIKDVANVLGGGGTITITIATLDSATVTPVDNADGPAAINWLTGLFGTSAGTLTATTATIDVGTGRLNLLATAPDTTTADNGAAVGLNRAVTGVNNAAGTAYGLIGGDKINLVFAGDLSGITTIAWKTRTYAVTTTDRTAGSATLALDGATDSALLDGTSGSFVITVDGVTVLATRTLTVTANLVLPSTSTGAGPAANNRAVLATSTLTVWSLNGTVLAANWVNGNNTSLNSRIYLYNPSSSGGSVVADVYTLAVGIGTATTKLGTVNLGTLGGNSTVNIRLAEDLLTPLGITLPYTANGGNLVVILTIQASNVSGFSQVFSSSLIYGTCNLTKVQ